MRLTALYAAKSLADQFFHRFSALPAILPAIVPFVVGSSIRRFRQYCVFAVLAVLSAVRSSSVHCFYVSRFGSTHSVFDRQSSLTIPSRASLTLAAPLYFNVQRRQRENSAALAAAGARFSGDFLRPAALIIENMIAGRFTFVKSIRGIAAAERSA